MCSFFVLFCFAGVRLLYIVLVSMLNFSVNQLHVYLDPLPLGLSSTLPPSHPSRLPQSTEPSSEPAGLRVLYTRLPLSVYTWQYICVKPNLPVHPTLPSLLCPHGPSLYLQLYSCPANRFICRSFLDSTCLC